MKIVSTNPLVFHDVQAMCDEVYGSDRSFDDAVLVLGYNVAKFTPADLRKQYPGYRIIVYQLEQLFNGSSWANQAAWNWLHSADEIWEYDLANLEWTSSQGIRSVYRPMRYCECLKDVPKASKDIDVLFYGYPTPRRKEIMAYWQGVSWDKYSTINATGVTGSLLNGLIARAKIVLNLHAFAENCRQEQVRMFRPVINGACVVSESSPYNEFGKAIVEMDSHDIDRVLPGLLDSGEWERISKVSANIYKKHCESRQ